MLRSNHLILELKEILFYQKTSSTYIFLILCLTTLLTYGQTANDEASQEIIQTYCAACHIAPDPSDLPKKLWKKIVTPLIQGGHWYQNQYPLLCSDRYLIVEACLELCDKIGTKNFAHGCTGMGNDQVRFDLTVHCLGKI